MAVKFKLTILIIFSFFIFSCFNGNSKDLKNQNSIRNINELKNQNLNYSKGEVSIVLLTNFQNLREINRNDKLILKRYIINDTDTGYFFIDRDTFSYLKFSGVVGFLKWEPIVYKNPNVNPEDFIFVDKHSVYIDNYNLLFTRKIVKRKMFSKKVKKLYFGKKIISEFGFIPLSNNSDFEIQGIYQINDMEKRAATELNLIPVFDKDLESRKIKIYVK